MRITAIKQQAKRTDRYSIFVDGKYAFSLSESGLIASGLASGRELGAAELKSLKKTAGLDKAYYNALRYAAMRPRSEWEMKMYLKRKEADQATADEVIRRLRDLNLELLAVYHSHPASDPVPSRRDVMENTYGETVVHLIVGLAGAEPEVRGWWITESGLRKAELMTS